MKKLFISALIALSVSLSSFAAEGNNVNYTVRYNFETQFANATEVKWTSGVNYQKATFVLNNVRIEALYNAEGEFIGTSRAVSTEELPVKVKRAFAKKYADYTVKEVIRFDGNEESAYFISAENEKGEVIIKAEETGYISTVK